MPFKSTRRAWCGSRVSKRNDEVIAREFAAFDFAHDSPSNHNCFFDHGACRDTNAVPKYRPTDPSAALDPYVIPEHAILYDRAVLDDAAFTGDNTFPLAPG